MRSASTVKNCQHAIPLRSVPTQLVATGHRKLVATDGNYQALSETSDWVATSCRQLLGSLSLHDGISSWDRTSRLACSCHQLSLSRNPRERNSALTMSTARNRMELHAGSFCHCQLQRNRTHRKQIERCHVNGAIVLRFTSRLRIPFIRLQVQHWQL